MTLIRRKTRLVKLGGVRIGSGSPVVVESMAKTKTSDVDGTVSEVAALREAGCEIVRVAIKDAGDTAAIKEIKKRGGLPIVADIHFDYRLALLAIESGADGIRLNPGNITGPDQIAQVIRRAKTAKVPIRIGVNSGSLSEKGKGAGQDRLMVKSAMSYLKHFEKARFRDIIISLKSSDVASTILAYREMAKLCDYPFHIGVTATGVEEDGIIKSAIGIGSLLSEGIGDTIRVSLTADPVYEVEIAKSILQALGLRQFRPEVISCPTCGRCQVDIEKVVSELKAKLNVGRRTWDVGRKNPIKIAVMGCEVNGPGEAKEAFIGIAAGKNSGVLFKNGKIVKRVKEKDFVKEILRELKDQRSKIQIKD